MEPTSRLGLDRPQTSDSATALRTAITGNADKLDAAALRDAGTLAARPTATSGSPFTPGFFYEATDTGQVFLTNSDGTAWIELPGVPLGAADIADGAITAPKLATDALNTFLKLLSAADRKVNMGTGVTPSFAGNPGANGSFAHGLGVTPMWWTAMFQQITVGGVGRIIVAADNGRNATTINYTARTIDEAAIPGQVNFVWAAIG